MKHLFLFSLVSVLLFGCSKTDLTPQGTTNGSEITSLDKVVTVNGLKIAERVSGIVICTVDEDILHAAIVNYYGATEFKSMDVHEYNPGTANSFYALTGRIKDGKAFRRFCFELVPFTLGDGSIELYVPFLGTQQNVTGPGNAATPLNLTSATTGYAASPQSVYATDASLTTTDDFGTNRLITLILAAL